MAITLVVEDGSGLDTANTYEALADADTYHESRGNTTWADAETEDRKAALVRATFAIDYWLRGKWNGTKISSTQALAWPRTDVTDEEGLEIDEDVVPTILKYATAEVALIELSERFLQQTLDSSNYVASESVGPISVSYRSNAISVKSYPQIERMLAGLAGIGGVSISARIGLTPWELGECDSLSVEDFADYFNVT